MPVQFELSKPYQRVLLDPVLPSATVGAVTGTSGLVVGGIAGILISQHPTLFSIASGIQCFGLGSSFWYFRSVLSEARTSARPTSRQELEYSTVAGSLSGALNGAFRSRSNVIPGAIMMGLLGFAGQGGYSILSAQDRDAQRSGNAPRRSFMQRLTESDWVPLKALSDQQYEEMLSEKLLKIEADVSLIDEKITALKLSQVSEPAAGPQDDMSLED